MAAAAWIGSSSVARAQASELPLSHWQHTMWTGRAGPPVPGAHYLYGSPDGYLWLSASNCLLRFDGVRFTVIDSTTTPVLRPKELGEFIPIFLDSQGVLWISGPGGERITYKDGQFRHAYTLPQGASGPVAEDPGGLIWMKEGRPHRYQNGHMAAIPLPAQIPASDIWLVKSDTGGGLWIGTRHNGLWHTSRSGEARQYGKGEIRPLIQARDGKLWAVGMAVKGTARLEGERWIQLRMPADSTVLFGRFAKEDAEGAIWFQTNTQGIVRYRKGVIDSYTTRDGLSDNRISDIHVDPAGVVWVSTEAGLDRIRPAAFAPLDPGHVVPGGIGATVAPDQDGGMWTTSGTANSVYLLHGGILDNGNKPLTAREFRFGEGQSVSLIAASARGGAWVKPFGGDLFYVKADGTRQSFGTRDGLANMRVLGGIETRDGALWMEIMGGTVGRLHNGKYKAMSVGAVTKPGVNAFAEDDRGRLWLAWGDQPILAVFQGDSLVANITVPTEHLDYIAPEHSDTVWAASEYGVYRIIGEKAVKVRVPGLERLLVSNMAIGIAQGSLWISSSGGIARVALAELHRAADGDSVRVTPRVFDVLDGVEGARAARMTYQSVIPGRDGRLWINTVGGLVMANPDARSAVRVPPRVLIEEVTVDGAPLSDSALIHARPGRIDIHFTATGLELPERARLEYRLDGADKDWVAATVPRVATYNHLHPGSYTFRARALNDDGTVAVSEKTIALRVPPAWDQAWWFFALVAVAVAASGAGIAVAWQRRRSRKEADRAQARFDAILYERTRVARELHDTLLGDMAGVAMQLDAGARRLEASGGERATVVELLSGLSTQVQQSLVDARRSVSAMREPPVELPPLHEQLAKAAQRTFADSGIAAQVGHAGPPRILPPTIESEIVSIVSEAMTNARKHASCNMVTVTCTYARHELRVTVRDDGRGFDPSRETPRGHWGLIGMRERAATIGADLDVRSVPRTGSEIVLVVRS